VTSPRAVIVTGGGTGIGAAAVDVGTLPFDPRIEIRL
jgi:hypothetical protein